MSQRNLSAFAIYLFGFLVPDEEGRGKCFSVVGGRAEKSPGVSGVLLRTRGGGRGEATGTGTGGGSSNGEWAEVASFCLATTSGTPFPVKSYVGPVWALADSRC